MQLLCGLVEPGHVARAPRLDFQRAEILLGAAELLQIGVGLLFAQVAQLFAGLDADVSVLGVALLDLGQAHGELAFLLGQVAALDAQPGLRCTQLAVGIGQVGQAGDGHLDADDGDADFHRGGNAANGGAQGAHGGAGACSSPRQRHGGLRGGQLARNQQAHIGRELRHFDGGVGFAKRQDGPGVFVGGLNRADDHAADCLDAVRRLPRPSRQRAIGSQALGLSQQQRQLILGVLEHAGIGNRLLEVGELVLDRLPQAGGGVEPLRRRGAAVGFGEQVDDDRLRLGHAPGFFERLQQLLLAFLQNEALLGQPLHGFGRRLQRLADDLRRRLDADAQARGLVRGQLQRRGELLAHDVGVSEQARLRIGDLVGVEHGAVAQLLAHLRQRFAAEFGFTPGGCQRGFELSQRLLARAGLGDDGADPGHDLADRERRKHRGRHALELAQHAAGGAALFAELGGLFSGRGGALAVALQGFARAAAGFGLAPELLVTVGQFGGQRFLLFAAGFGGGGELGQPFVGGGRLAVDLALRGREIVGGDAGSLQGAGDSGQLLLLLVVAPLEFFQRRAGEVERFHLALGGVVGLGDFGRQPVHLFLGGFVLAAELGHRGVQLLELGKGLFQPGGLLQFLQQRLGRGAGFLAGALQFLYGLQEGLERVGALGLDQEAQDLIVAVGHGQSPASSTAISRATSSSMMRAPNSPSFCPTVSDSSMAPTLGP